MNKDRFIKLLTADNQLQILYETHVDYGKRRLNPSQFTFEMQKMRIMEMTGTFSTNNFYSAVVKHYMSKFQVNTLSEVETGRVIRYY